MLTPAATLWRIASRPRVVVGAVAEVGEHVLVGRERRLAHPRHAFAAHLAEGHRAAVHPHRHVVAADAGHRARAFGHLGAGVVRAAAAKPRRAVRASSALIVCRLRSLASMIAMRASMRLAMSALTPSFFRRLAIAFAMIAGVRSAFARSSQFSLGFGIDHSPPRRVVVELAEHVRPHVGAPVVELFLQLVLDDLALFLDDEDLLQALARTRA